GHSKWNSIKRKKAKEDAKRGRIFTKLGKEITVAVRIGGGDPEANTRLRQAILAAKANNMPADNIKKAIQRGTGELNGTSYEEAIYEGYGPGGVALMVSILTDNRNRTTPEIRYIFTKYSGSLGESGCVSWIFDRKGYIVVEKGIVSEDEFMELAITAGAEDMRDDGSNYEIITATENFERVYKFFEEHNITMVVSEISMIPKNTIKIEDKTAQQVLKMLEAFEDHDDVQDVWANFDIDESEIEG
ncbi:MAG: YebC/PmpR family DNA-binding transcriptional regulator, partial [Thermoplasmata archaeon]|nr:YebC/PmpR family DNA-binding transcriptional regulator [Thermoplasmata archaeon]